LVQELVWENLDPKSKAESFIDAVRILSYAFSKCPSPSNHVSLDGTNDEEQDISFSPAPDSISHFYMWSKFCIHGHRLRRNVEDLLVSLDSVCLDSVWFPETAKILYECAVHLSANHQQEEAKRTLNFAYRILDWLPVAGYDMVEKNVSDDFLFPLPIPLPELFQMMIQRFWIPTFILLESLTEKPAPKPGDFAPDGSDFAPDASDFAREASDLDLDTRINKFELDGNKAFKEGFFQEALDAYSSTINLAEDCNKPFDPLLLTSRSMVHIKLEQWENALKEANDYITRRPCCWRGYALKALALDGLNKDVSADRNDKASAEIAAALAFYHNRAIFADFPIFVECFPDLQSRIFICDSVDELLDAMFSQEVETGLLKILVLGSEEYILNYSETVDKPWNNYILVGTRKNCSVSLKSNYDISLLKCLLTNLSFSFNKCQLYCLPNSFVKIFNCNFTSYDDFQTIITKGVFNAEQCNFTSSPLVCREQSRAVVHDCSFCNNAACGLRVEEGGTLKVENSRIYNNGDDGLYVYKSECVASNCDIHYNGYNGIRVHLSKNVTLIRNNVHNNNTNGIYMVDSLVDVKENKLFDNGAWGIAGEDNPPSNISMNQIFRNKCGGIRHYWDPGDKTFSLSVVELNTICYNGGPGLVVDDETLKVAESRYMNYPNSVQSAKFQNNEIHDNKENENVSKLNLSVPYCSYCRVKWELTMCEKCFTTAYCSESCQKEHYSKHKEICKVLREKSSYLITSTEEVDEDDMGIDGPKENFGREKDDCSEHEDDIGIDNLEDLDPQEIGPKRAPPRDGMRFVVKVHGTYTNKYIPGHNLPSYFIILYDRERELTVKFDSKVIEQLVREFGVLCTSQGNEQKLYFHCLREDKGQIRLFTNEFAEFQNW
jgi:parallel beta-helix repeat protein